LNIQHFQMEVYEQRTTEAETRISELTARISKLETGSTLSGSGTSQGGGESAAAIKEAVRRERGETLLKLRALRDAMKAEGQDLSQVKSERDQALAENEELKKENEKLNYRIKHLLRSLEEAEQT